MIGIKYRSDMRVDLIGSLASDSAVAMAARVSTGGTASEDPKKDAGLINYLMRDRHGCYSADTQVLTRRGWVDWASAVESDLFITRNLQTNEIVYQKAQRIVAKPYKGKMFNFKNKHLDLLVTPNHNMIASHRVNATGKYTNQYLTSAESMVGRSYRVPKGGGVWDGKNGSLSSYEIGLVGFFIGDGSSNARGKTPVFNIRKQREISYLESVVSRIPGAEISLLKSGARSVVGLSTQILNVLRDCYSDDKQKQIPEYLLDYAIDSLESLLDGLMSSDGNISGKKKTYYTTSEKLAGQIQELCLKLGHASDIRMNLEINGKYAGIDSKPIFVVSIFSGRNSNPRLGWTLANREKEITTVDYDGMVYCSTVENGTLFVRRNGKTAWCGNSPFEHNLFTFYIEAPIFVFREFMRHRIASYNEESGRYKELDPVFYVPSRERKLIQQGKPGAYEFVDGNPEHFEVVEDEITSNNVSSYEHYQRMLDAGIAREVARAVLPVNLYSSMYVSINARSLMNFLSLRTAREGTHFPSFPQREIEMVAEKMEEFFAEKMPITYETFNKNGRVAP